MNIALSNRPKLVLEDSSEDISPLEDKQINLSSNELIIAQILSGKKNLNKYQKSQNIAKRTNTLMSSENELAETSSNTIINPTPILSSNYQYISQSARKEMKNYESKILKTSTMKLSEYLQKSEKCKYKERKDPSFLIKVKKNLKFGDDANEKNKKERRDWNGTVICKKNRRKVQVTFADWAGDEPLTSIIYIESFKNFNFIKNMPKEDFIIKPTCECCNIF